MHVRMLCLGRHWNGQTYRYERGERATVTLRWDDARRTLHIGARQGRYLGMATRRELRVRVAGPAGQVQPPRTVQYRGRALTLHLGRDMTNPAPDAGANRPDITPQPL